MGDVGDFWNDVKDHFKTERRRNRSYTAQHIAKLEAAGHTVVNLNDNGPHLRINGSVDFWPSTGTWRRLNGKRQGVGIDSLLRHLENNK